MEETWLVIFGFWMGFAVCALLTTWFWIMWASGGK